MGNVAQQLAVNARQQQLRELYEFSALRDEERQNLWPVTLSIHL